MREGVTSSPDDMRVGIGMHFAEVSAGALGSKNRFAITVLGDPVNLAARIESLTRKYEIGRLFTRDVFERLPPDQAEKALWIDRVMVKGREGAEVDLFAFSPLSRRHWADYDAARNLYFEGEFTQAASRFRFLPGSLAAMMALRCEQLEHSNDANGWKGAYTWPEK